MLKKYDGTNWNTASYGKYFSGTEQFTNFPLVIRSLDQSVQAYTIKGNTSASGTPSPQNPITIDGVGNKTANLFNKDDTWVKRSQNDSVVIDGDDIIITTTLFCYTSADVKANTDYIISCTSSGGIARNIAVYKSTTFTTENLIASLGATGGTFNTSSATKIYILFYASNNTQSSTATYSKVMMNEGTTALPYDEYNKYKISIVNDSSPLTPIYVSKQLLKVRDYSDDISSNNTASFRIQKAVLTGDEEGWSNVGTGDSRYYRLSVSVLNTIISDAAMSTHYEWTDITSSTTGNGVDSVNSTTANISGIAIRDLNYATLTQFKAYLAQQYANGTPVIVWYVLTTPTTESVTAPTILTTGGTATIDVDTTVKPSEMSLTYNGKHLNKSKKYNGNNWI